VDATVPIDILANALIRREQATMANTGDAWLLRHRRLPKYLRIVRARPRLFMCGAFGLLVLAGLMFTNWRIAVRLLVAWDVAVALYLALVLHLAVAADAHHIRRRARLQDESRIAILVLTAVAALASLGAIFALLGSSGENTRRTIDLFLATITIVISWAFTHTMFALHYAHEFYDENGGKGGGMSFPGDDAEPDYWDFLYFSFVIGMCAQVSDVTVTCKPIRRTVFAHSVVSFIFNAALLALTVNIAASAI
jgi:uncharacterized membrane protein